MGKEVSLCLTILSIVAVQCNIKKLQKIGEKYWLGQNVSQFSSKNLFSKALVIKPLF